MRRREGAAVGCVVAVLLFAVRVIYVRAQRKAPVRWRWWQNVREKCSTWNNGMFCGCRRQQGALAQPAARENGATDCPKQKVCGESIFPTVKPCGAAYSQGRRNEKKGKKCSTWNNEKYGRTFESRQK